MTKPSASTARKKQLRLKAGRTRSLAARRDDGAVARALSSFLASLRPGCVLAGYLAIGSEVDVLPALESWCEEGHPVALPCTGPRDTPLVFRRWAPGRPLVQEPFGTRAPRPEAPVVDPDVLLVPLLAFDRAGYRLGWGGGYYDRTLSSLRGRKSVTAVGVAYSAQEIPSVPRDPWDQPLDLIVTEEGVIRPRR